MGRIDNKITSHQKTVVEILKSEARDFPLQPELQDQIIADTENNHFQLLRIGWIEDDRILHVLIHIDIKPDGKIWIQENHTETVVEDELIKRGVPASEIVLGTAPPSYRKFTAFAEC